MSTMETKPAIGSVWRPRPGRTQRHARPKVVLSQHSKNASLFTVAPLGRDGKPTRSRCTFHWEVLRHYYEPVTP